MAPPTTFGVVAEREVYIIKEAIPGTIPASIGVPVPVTSFKPSNKPIWIEDESMQGHMGANSGIYQGPLIAGFDIDGHVTPDILPHWLYNLLGDYTATGTAGTGSTTLTAQCAAGATTATVGSITGFSSGQSVQLGITADGNPEIVTLSTAPSGSTLTFTNTPARFTHASGKNVAGMVAPYTHVFALLNGSVGAANGPAQGPTHCVTDREGITANGAAQFAYSCVGEVTLTGNAEKLLDWSAKIVCLVRQAAAAPVGMTNVSAVVPYPSWMSVTGIGGLASGGTQVKDIAEWSVTMTRTLKAMNTNQGSQAPYIIARGKLDVTGKNTVSPAIDDSNVTALLANTQPQLQYVASNGLAGANLGSVQADIVLGAYQAADITDADPLFGFDVPWKAVSTAAAGAGGVTTTGASGGKSPVKITVVNAVPTY